MADEREPLLVLQPNRSRCKGVVAIACIYMVTLLQRSAYYCLENALSLIVTSRGYDGRPLLFQGTANFFGVFGGLLSDAVIGTQFSTLVGAIIMFIGATISFFNAYDVFPQVSGSTLFEVGLYVLSLGSAIFQTCLAVLCGEQTTRYFGAKNLIRGYVGYYVFVNLGSVIASVYVAKMSDSGALYRNNSTFVISTIFATIFVLMLGFRVFTRLPPTNRSSPIRLLVKAYFARGSPCCRPSHFFDHSLTASHHAEEQEAVKRCAKQIAKLVTIFTSIITCFTIYSLKNSRFEEQANATNLHFPGLNHNLDSPTFYDGVFCILFAPLLYFGVFPIVNRCVPLSPLHRIGFGLVLMPLSLMASGIVQIHLADCLWWSTLPQIGMFALGEVAVVLSGNIVEYLLGAFHATSHRPLAWGTFLLFLGLEFSFTQAPQGLVASVMGLFMCSEGVGAFVGYIIQIASGADESDAAAVTAIFSLFGASVLSFIFFIVVSRHYEYNIREELQDDGQEMDQAS